ncbi:MAG: hypothetical protein BGP06_13820 [Rhizobiales bacterium 65-9]|nr:MAG: hypothetical protein BGP06_13820 [Rhizobiales bacterium 65-9]
MLRFWRSFSGVGLMIGTLFFAASLTPSLIPRNFATQGVLSGCALAAGYGLGVFFRWLWRYLELPEPEGRLALRGKQVAMIGCALVAALFLWRAAGWQNSIRALMGMTPVDTAHPLEVGAIALLAFAILLLLARLFRVILQFAARRARSVAPRRVSNVVGAAIAIAVFWAAIDGVLFRFALRAADSSFRAVDALMEPDAPRPSDPNKTGSAGSLVEWADLGRMGRSFVASGPTRETLRAFLKRDAMEPLRVYVGLRSGETAEERAKLALEELKRVGGFARSSLVVIMPTGTGWIDPEGIDPLEYLHRGDVASVAIQYSYLASWLSLLTEPGYGDEAARALFKEIYGYWTTLPKDDRPKLYLYGLSLGALSSEKSSELFEVIGDPYQGVLWAGPPFPSRIWRSATDNRNPGSPAWLPRFRDGSYIRFTNQTNALGDPVAGWGPIRLVYLQYASDPITFFEIASLYRRPAWMIGPRGPDVSPDLRWYPVVTFMQLLLDVMMATQSPMGHGHVYAGAHYIDPWIAVTDVRDWSPDEIARLKRFFSERAQ